MAPAYDEFEEKDRRKRSRSDPLRALPRIRRNRRTTALFMAIIVLGLYYTFGPSRTSWSRSPLDDLVDTEDLFAPYYQYNPVLGSADRHGDTREDTQTPTMRIRFPYLYSSLVTSSAAGLRSWNQNVLFAAGNIGAARRLAVTACEMSVNDRAQVHFVLLGDSSISMDDFQNLSGAGSDSECQITFHDATTLTPLTLPLLEKAVKSALIHVHRFLHPQVIIIDPENEDIVVLKTLKESADRFGTPVIELPENAAQNLRWMAKLSTQSLRAWNRPKVEIFIRCDKHNGNLERLLKSLRNADYYGILPSRVTIEVGSVSPFHRFTQEFIQNFNWPSRDRVGIRYPISPPGSDSVSQAIHHVQSFFPIDKDTSVLFLDPNVELSPYYFHWLHYVTLEYMYSSYPYNAGSSLHGISLTSPRAFLNGTEPFDPQISKPSSFLYAAPSTDAALFFPEHWLQFYTYFQWRMRFALPERASPDVPALTEGDDKKPVPLSSDEKTDHHRLSGTTRKEQAEEKDTADVDLLSGVTSKDEDRKKHKAHPDEELTASKDTPEPKEFIPDEEKPNPPANPNLPDAPKPPPRRPPPPPTKEHKRDLSQPPPSALIQRNFTLPNVTPSPNFTPSWLLYFTEFALLHESLMLYPNFGATPEAQALAILHSETPSHTNSKPGGGKNPGEGESRLIPSGTLLDVLPGWELPPWNMLLIRDMSGEKSSESQIMDEALNYQSQVSNNCAEEEIQDLIPVVELFLCE